MSDSCHLANERDKKQQNRQQQAHPETQGFNEFSLVEDNNTMELTSTSTRENFQSGDMSSAAFSPSTFNNYYYDNSQWIPSDSYSRMNEPPQEYYTIQQPINYLQQNQIYPQEHYNTHTPTGSIYSATTPLENNSFNKTPSTSASTPMTAGPSQKTSYFPFVQQDEAQKSSATSIAPQVKDKNTISSPSSVKTPIPSPVITNKRKTRASTAPIPGSSRQHAMAAVDGVVTGSPKKKQRVAINAEEETEEEKLTINHLEKELSFLKDDCTAILIMLDSLRNAFLAGESSIQGDSSRANDKRRRSKTAAQNMEIQREMRIAYDDLMLQVRQLEKKIEKLEEQSRTLAEENDGDELENKSKKRKTE